MRAAMARASASASLAGSRRRGKKDRFLVREVVVDGPFDVSEARRCRRPRPCDTLCGQHSRAARKIRSRVAILLTGNAPGDVMTLIRIGHSPDPDDAFMFYALTAAR